jgi:hypothetical protein
MTTRYFNVKTGLTTGNITLDADSGTANVSNVAVLKYVLSNLNPGSSGIYNLGNTSLRYKDVFLSNELNINGQSITANATSVIINSQLTINNSTDSTSVSTGSITTLGGMGITKDLTVGGNINLANAAGNAKGVINYNDTSESIDFKFNG